VATIAGATINFILEHRKAKQASKIEALTIAISLEGYAITCADKLVDHDTATSSGGHAGSLLASLPDLPPLSVVAGFLRPGRESIANKIMTFPQEVRQADQLVSFWWDVVGDEDAMRQAAVYQVAQMGLQSLNLASEIRTEFNLPIRDLIFGEYDVRQILEKVKQ
jgi:hypothetical protein